MAADQLRSYLRDLSVMAVLNVSINFMIRNTVIKLSQKDSQDSWLFPMIFRLSEFFKCCYLVRVQIMRKFLESHSVHNQVVVDLWHLDIIDSDAFYGSHLGITTRANCLAYS